MGNFKTCPLNRKGEKTVKGEEKKKKIEEQTSEKINSTFIVRRKLKPFTRWLRTLLNIHKLRSVPSDVHVTTLTPLIWFVVSRTSQSTRYLLRNVL